MDALVSIDESGRMVLPKKIRDVVRSDRFSVEVVSGDRIVFTPIHPPKRMFGSMPDLDIKGFQKQHNRER